MNARIIATVALVLLIAAPVFAQSVNTNVNASVVNVAGAEGFNYEPAVTTEDVTSKVVVFKHFKMYTPREIKIMGLAHFNASRLLIFTVWRLPGEQSNPILEGQATSYLYFDTAGVLRKTGCHNRVTCIIAEAREEVRLESRNTCTTYVQKPPAPVPCNTTINVEKTPAPVNNNYNYTTNISYSFGPSAMGSYQLGGSYGSTESSCGFASFTLQQPSSISVVSIAKGGAGGSSNVTNNNSNSNSNVNTNNNVINVGKGSATGTATGTGSSTAKSGGKK